MKKFILISALALAACASGLDAEKASLDGANRLALAYTTTPRCPTQAPICSDQSIVDKIKASSKTAYDAIYSANPNSSVIDNAISELQSILNSDQVKSVLTKAGN